MSEPPKQNTGRKLTIEDFIDEDNTNKNNLNEKYVTRLEKFLDMLNDDDTKFTDEDNQRTYNSYKAYKINSIKLLIYNESDKKKLEALNSISLEEKLFI